MSAIVQHTNKGILNVAAGKLKFTLERHLPAPDLRWFIQRYWVITWDLREQAPYRQTVIPHPNVNLVFEKNNTRIYGTSTAASS